MRCTIAASTLFAAVLAVPAVQYGGESYGVSTTTTPVVHYSASTTSVPVVYGSSSEYKSSSSSSSVSSYGAKSSSYSSSSTSCYESSVYYKASSSSVGYYASSHVVYPTGGYSVQTSSGPFPTSYPAGNGGNKPTSYKPTGTGSYYPTHTGPAYTGGASGLQAAGLLAGAGAVAALFL